MELLIAYTCNTAKIVMRMNLTVQNKINLLVKYFYFLSGTAFRNGYPINSHVSIQVFKILLHIMYELLLFQIPLGNPTYKRMIINRIKNIISLLAKLLRKTQIHPPPQF
ncbi:hypothetical protein D3C81_1161280 [compost metagenome]